MLLLNMDPQIEKHVNHDRQTKTTLKKSGVFTKNKMILLIFGQKIAILLTIKTGFTHHYHGYTYCIVWLNLQLRCFDNQQLRSTHTIFQRPVKNNQEHHSHRPAIKWVTPLGFQRRRVLRQVQHLASYRTCRVVCLYFNFFIVIKGSYNAFMTLNQNLANYCTTTNLHGNR